MSDLDKMLEMAGYTPSQIMEYRRKKQDAEIQAPAELEDDGFEDALAGDIDLSNDDLSGLEMDDTVDPDEWAGSSKGRFSRRDTDFRDYDELSFDDDIRSLSIFDDIDLDKDQDDDFSKSLKGKNNSIVDVGDDEDFMFSLDDDDFGDLDLPGKQYNEANETMVNKEKFSIQVGGMPIDFQRKADQFGVSWYTTQFGNVLELVETETGENEYSYDIAYIYDEYNTSKLVNFLDDIGMTIEDFSRDVANKLTAYMGDEVGVDERTFAEVVSEATLPIVDDQDTEDGFAKSLKGKNNSIVDVGDEDFVSDYEDREYAKSLFDSKLSEDGATSDTIETVLSKVKGMMSASNEDQQRADEILSSYGFGGSTFGELEVYLGTLGYDELSQLADEIDEKLFAEGKSEYNQNYGEEKVKVRHEYDTDMFPNGAANNAMTKVGPTGARNGDNALRTKMNEGKTAKVYRELVESYKLFTKRV